MTNELRRLTKEETKNYKELGTASGTFEVCLFMANKYVPDFVNRVVGFYVEDGGTAEMINSVVIEFGLTKEKSIEVTFYEKN